MASKVTIRGVLDGHRFDMPDGGHEKGAPDQPMASRQAIQSILKKTDSDDQPLFYLTARQAPFTSYGVPMTPIKGPVWGPAQDDRLAENLGQRSAERAAAVERVADGTFARGPDADVLAKALAEKAAAEEAKGAAGGQQVDPEAAAKKAADKAAKKAAKDAAAKAAQDAKDGDKKPS